MTGFYSEIDPGKAQWLRNLIAADVIAPGVVDERDLRDIRPDDLMGYTQVHLCAGIGIWSYALRGAGWRDDRPVWTASFPCQPFSSAGKRMGIADERHLWPAGFHLITQCAPPVILGEQVASPDGLAWLDVVQADMEGAGHAIGAADTCAAGFGAPHIRQRLYFAAVRLEHATGERWAEGRTEPVGRGTVSRCGPGGVEYTQRDGSQGWLSGRADTRRENLDGSVGRDSTTLGLAHLHEDGQREGRECIPASGDDGAVRDGATGSMADTTSTGHERGRSGEAGHGRDASRQQPERLCDVVGVADTHSDRAQREPGDPSEAPRLPQEQREPKHDPDVSQRGGTDRDGHDDMRGHGLPGHNRPADPTNGFWANPDWLGCRDGKFRPVEPGTFPLVDGAPSRVLRLRAYGDGIVAPQAVEFIKAFDEVTSR